MNNYNELPIRKRSRHLIIVEGEHEKDELFKVLLKSFEEIDIDIQNVIIYGTNIYELYDEIVKEYGESWDKDDVDLPYIVSRKTGHESTLYKRDFMNILLVFDYERQDPAFSEEKIQRLQAYFNDVTDMGNLFINYPMNESYQHLSDHLPDHGFETLSVPIFHKGDEYKRLVRDSRIAKLIGLPKKINEILTERFDVRNLEVVEKCVEQILKLNNAETLFDDLTSLLNGIVPEEEILTAIHQLVHLVTEYEYVKEGQNYFEYMRKLFSTIICHNICKANKIQNDKYRLEATEIKECFGTLNFETILEHQNAFGREQQKIWVLNTCIFFIPDYNFRLLDL